MVLGIALSTGLYAQQTASPSASAAATNAAMEFPPPSPISKTTLDFRGETLGEQPSHGQDSHMMLHNVGEPGVGREQNHAGNLVG